LVKAPLKVSLPFQTYDQSQIILPFSHFVLNRLLYFQNVLSGLQGKQIYIYSLSSSLSPLHFRLLHSDHKPSFISKT